MSQTAWADDPVIQPLIAAARANPELEGLILSGSRGAGVHDAEGESEPRACERADPRPEDELAPLARLVVAAGGEVATGETYLCARPEAVDAIVDDGRGFCFAGVREGGNRDASGSEGNEAKEVRDTHKALRKDLTLARVPRKESAGPTTREHAARGSTCNL